MPRYVVLFHELPASDARDSHWDVMLERDGTLLTWATGQRPAPISMLMAERLADHRMAYLDYEGPVSQNRGTVTRVDAGNFEWLDFEEDRITVRVTSGDLIGELTLQRHSAGQRWLLNVSPTATS